MDEFGWGNTRLVIGEGSNKKIVMNDDEKLDESMIPLKKFSGERRSIDMNTKVFMTFSCQSTKPRLGRLGHVIQMKLDTTLNLTPNLTPARLRQEKSPLITTNRLPNRGTTTATQT